MLTGCVERWSASREGADCDSSEGVGVGKVKSDRCIEVVAGRGSVKYCLDIQHCLDIQRTVRGGEWEWECRQGEW